MPGTHPVKEYVKRVASVDLEEYPEWNLARPLPKLPVPDLASTLQKYLASVEHLIPEEQYGVTKALVADFGRPGGEGQFLQEKLQEVAEIRDNWAYNWWLEDMYMNVKLPLPCNSNPGTVLPRQNFRNEDEWLRFSARLISGILDYKTIIDARGLPVDRCRHQKKGQPLCMEQYYRLFTSYRLPGINKDSLVTSNSNIVQDPEHIIVACKNQFFVLDVVVNFNRLSEDDLFMQLRRIVCMCEEGDQEDPVGILTSLERDTWAKARMALMEGKEAEDSTNRDSMDAIERCIFILCLDDYESGPHCVNGNSGSLSEPRSDVSVIEQMLHGSGSKCNGANRWYDKTMQFIICRDGNNGLNYEHSPAEGIAVVVLLEHVLRYMEEVRVKKLIRMNSICELPPPRKLTWKLSDACRREIIIATQKLDRMVDNLDIYILHFENFGKEFPKSQNMSPDSFIQLALQLTFYKVHGHLCHTYESASTRRFRFGRVDNIRSASRPALEWVKTMTGEVEASDVRKMELLRKAMQWQTDVMIQTILGHGLDIHLLGLREMAVELNRPTPPIFQDNTYLSSNKFVLSTSQVPTTMDAFIGYGPVVPNGYGAAYNPVDGRIVVCVSSFNGCEETNSEMFSMSLESSLMQMHEICLKTNLTSPLNRMQEVQANGEAPPSPKIRPPKVRSRSRSGNGSMERSPLMRQKRTISATSDGTTNGK
uniref:Choline O-acetyltransferase n=1 Tax=Lineus ruber TaxID=88926 RepID=A0A2I6QBQ3_LINRU|nr:choline O-acetyltransferase [Lineus ruber]